MTSWLIDDGGKIWPADSERLRETLWSLQSTADHCRYSVINLGFASLQITPRAIFVRWRPTFVTKETVVGLIQALADQRESRVVISTLGLDWSDCICRSIGQAREVILREFETAHCHHGGYYRARRWSIDSLSIQTSLGGVFAHSLRAGFDFEPISLWSMLEEHAGGRFILTEQQGEDGRLKVLAWGEGYRSFNNDWTTNAVGRDFEDQPDASYAKWAAASYKAANAAGAPIVEDVEASTWWPGRNRLPVPKLDSNSAMNN
jgi:hypothetical protein